MRTSKQKIVFYTGKFNFLNPDSCDRRYMPMGTAKKPATATKRDLKKLAEKRGAK